MKNIETTRRNSCKSGYPGHGLMVRYCRPLGFPVVGSGLAIKIPSELSSRGYTNGTDRSLASGLFSGKATRERTGRASISAVNPLFFIRTDSWGPPKSAPSSDSCPHRRMTLSLGRGLRISHLSATYHGCPFDAEALE